MKKLLNKIKLLFSKEEIKKDLKKVWSILPLALFLASMILIFFRYYPITGIIVFTGFVFYVFGIMLLYYGRDKNNEEKEEPEEIIEDTGFLKAKVEYSENKMEVKIPKEDVEKTAQEEKGAPFEN